MPDVDAVVTGAGGFIGGHLVASLLGQGRSVRAVDIKPFDEWSQGLLMAVAMIVAGWDGGPIGHAPGFPTDGTWEVKAESLLPMP